MEMNLQATVLILKKFEDGEADCIWGKSHSSVSMLISPDGSRLGFVEPASTSPSEDKVNAPVPDDEPNKNWPAGASVEGDGERL